MKSRQQEQDVIYIINGGDAYGYGEDPSQKNIVNASKGTSSIDASNSLNLNASTNTSHLSIEIDQEVLNLLNFLAKQQSISPELALKKAVVTAAYFYDLTTSQGGKLLVQRKDNSVGKIILK
jgi:hypothetical protein